MKTRELTAEEVNITISVKDISSIIPNPQPELPVNPMAVEAIKTGLKLRGKGKNIFVCGPSAPEREAVILKAAADIMPGADFDIVITENSDNLFRPLVKELPPGSAKGFIAEEKAAGRAAAVLKEAGIKPSVIYENNPVPERLFGTDGNSVMQLTPGSLIKSAGGLLILNAEDLLEEEESWKLLKRMLRNGRTIAGARAAGMRQLKGAEKISKDLILPEFNADMKVAILGNEQHFDHFYNTDEDFRELFQFFGELDSIIELNEKNLADLVNYYRNFAKDNLERLLTDEAVFEILKYSIAAAENKTKLSTITSEVELLITEASCLKAPATDSSISENSISNTQIKKAIKIQDDRFNLLEQRIIEDIQSGVINLLVEGSEIGKVNGLAIIDKGPWSFGSPGLISARIAPGENGLVNIEHEAGLSGEIHDKWVLILEGFLRSRFAHDFPISIFASICFEQSYSEIDGDSASSSELYALLSAIAGVPIRQDIAVTGSLSQTGEIQAVGGLREKIEGFYKVCRAINFTGLQGVIVPERNIKNIVLPDEIIEDIRKEQFHIYPVSTVDDSMEILTGQEAGNRNSRGMFPNGTLNHLIEKNLKKLASQAKNFGN